MEEWGIGEKIIPFRVGQPGAQIQLCGQAQVNLFEPVSSPLKGQDKINLKGILWRVNEIMNVKCTGQWHPVGAQ